MKVLGMDSAMAACSVALLEDASIIARESEPMEHGMLRLWFRCCSGS